MLLALLDTTDKGARVLPNDHNSSLNSTLSHLASLNLQPPISVSELINHMELLYGFKKEEYDRENY
jgi:hypothetical protein